MKLHTVACVLLLVSIFLSCALSEETTPKVAVLLTVQPNPAFTGENVTFICDKEGEDKGWILYKDGQFVNSTDQNRFVLQADPNTYQCYSLYKTTQIGSDVVTLIVSAKPTPTLASDRTSVFASDIVTLTCTVEDSTAPDSTAPWDISWYKDNLESRPVTGDGSTYSPSVPESTQYWCRGGRGDPPYQYTHYSSSVYINVSERTAAVLTVLPNPAFTGETVTFTCHMGEGQQKDWSYTISKDGASIKKDKYTGQNPYVFITISTRSSGEYECTGRLTENDQVSKRSDKVTLKVSAQPKPTLTSDRTSVLTSNSVTVSLTCTVEDSTPPWNIYWYRAKKDSEPLKDVPGGTTYTFSPTTVSRERYYCRGGRGDTPYYTEYSNHVDITVSEVVPGLSTQWPETFIGETLILKCTIPSASDWTYIWFKNGAESSKENSNEYILGPSENPSGQYQCVGQRKDKQYSKRSEITVSLKDKPQANLTAEQTVIPAGGSVALSCSVEGSVEGSGWNYYWYSDSTGPITASDAVQYYDSIGFLRELEGGEDTTGPFVVSEGGVYRCRGGRARRGDALYYSHLSDALTLTTPVVSPTTPRPPGQTSLHVGLIVGLVVVVLVVLSILLLLLWRYRTKNKDKHAAKPNPESGDVTYSQIELKNTSKTKEEAADPSVTYAQVNYQNKTKANKKGGAAAEDVTYAQVNFQNKTKANNKKESPAPQPTEDAVYSEVKPGTSLGGK